MLASNILLLFLIFSSSTASSTTALSVSPSIPDAAVTSSDNNTALGIDITTNNVTATASAENSPAPSGQFINTFQEPVLPVANFSTDIISGQTPLTVRFTDLSKNVTKWHWDFGDGTSSTEQYPTHTYVMPGNYTVILTTKGPWIQGITSKVVRVGDSKVPVADFSASQVCGKTPLTVAFTDKSIGSPTVWCWCFGDGSNSTVESPIHTYRKAGKYNVNLTVKNSKGNDKVTKCNYIVVVDTPLKANVTDKK